MPNKRIKIGAKGYISASQVANMYGCGYGTMLDLYNRYKGLAPEVEPSEEAKASMEFGTFFEDGVAKFASKKLGFGKLIKCGTMAYYKEERPKLICHPDRLVEKHTKEGFVALEIKCVSPYAEGWGEDGTDQIPDNYFFQVQTYFACGVPCDVVYVCCMKGNRIHYYKILPNKELIKDIQDRADNCIKNFENDIIPSSENYQEQLAITKEKVDWQAEAVGANDEFLSWYERLKEIKATKDSLDEQEKAIKKEVLSYMGTSSAVMNTEDGKVKKIAYLLQKSRVTYDMDKLKANYPNVDWENYCKTTNSVELRMNYK